MPKVNDFLGARSEVHRVFLGETISQRMPANEPVYYVHVGRRQCFCRAWSAAALHSVGPVDRHVNHLPLYAILTVVVSQMPTAHKWSYPAFFKWVESRQLWGLGRISVPVRNTHCKNLPRAVVLTKRRERGGRSRERSRGGEHMPLSEHCWNRRVPISKCRCSIAREKEKKKSEEEADCFVRIARTLLVLPLKVR